jgi:hypothetical protein
MPSAELNKNDFASVTWQRLRLHLESRLQILRLRNDASLSPEDTAHIRGQISALKTLLALEKDPAKPTTAGESPLS